MPAQPNLKSASLANLDASQVLRPTAGAEGGSSLLQIKIGICGPTTSGDTTGGLLRMLRLPSNIILQKLSYCQQAATVTAAFSFGLYYSDTLDGTTSTNVNASATAIMATLFGSAIDTHAATTWVDTTFANASGYLPNDTVNPLWQAANSTLTSDPGGYLDICALNTATISGAATLLLRAEFVMPAQ